jgi:flagellar protein FliS
MYDRTRVRNYQSTDIASMSREKLIVLLYEKAIRCLEQAETALASGNRTATVERLSRAQRIVTELRNALDHDIGGEVAGNLAAIYDYVVREILAVLVDRDPRHLGDCVRVLTPLLEAWRQVPCGTAERERSGPTAQPTGAGPDPARESAEHLFSVSA